MELQVFTRQDIARRLSMPRTIELMRDAFRALSGGRIDSPVRTVLTNDAGTVLYKPAWSSQDDIFCVKIVSVFPENAVRDLPVTPGVLIVNDGRTGLPRAIMEAGYLTSLRTGAASGVATDLLAVPDATTAALFGTGGQAWHQLEAMLCVRPLRRVFVFSRNPDNASRFCKQHQPNVSDCELIPTTDSRVLRTCQVITTATTSATPVFADADIHPPVHINAVGSLGPSRSEIPAETILRSAVFVDHRAACLPEAGELLPLLRDGRLPADFCPPELGELLESPQPVRPGRLTVFKSAGNAAQDLVCAAALLRAPADPDQPVIRL